MTIDLTQVDEVTASEPDVEDASGLAPTAQIDLTQATVATVRLPQVEPVPMTGKEKAGVWLTWGVLVILGVFVLLILVMIWIYESGASLTAALAEVKTGPAAANPDPQAVKDIVEQLELQRSSFRTFLLEIVEKVLLNVLLPVLTALLGYIFGTSQQTAPAPSADDS